MSPRPPGPCGPADHVDAWLAEARRDDPGNPALWEARSSVFKAVGGDRNGQAVARLTSLTADARADVRLLALRLFTDLASTDLASTAPAWPEAAEAALVRLADPEGPVRRAAAWLLAEADRGRAVELLTGPQDGPVPPDPVVRLALAEALLVRGAGRAEGFEGLVERLRTDPDAALRLRAAPAPDSHAVLADLDAAGKRIGRAGGRLEWRIGTLWGLAARRSDAESDCFAQVAMLAARAAPVARQAAVDMAGEALRHWRAAPAALGPHLQPLLGDPLAGEAALSVLGASLEATRLCREELVAELTDAAEPTGHGRKPQAGSRSGTATLALARIGDVRALPGLCRMVREAVPVQGQGAGRGRGMGEAVRGLADVPGTDLAPLVSVATELLDRCGEGGDVRALTVLSACGAASAPAVPQLVRLLGSVVTRARADAGPRPGRSPVGLTQLVSLLGQIGPAAADALPLLEAMAAQGLGERAGLTTMALIRISGERRRAEEALARLGDTPREVVTAANLLEWLAGHGGLEPGHVAYLREKSVVGPYAHPRLLTGLWRHAGDEAAGILLDALLPASGSGELNLYACRILAGMGPAAAPAAAALTAVTERRIRVPEYTGDEDEDMREDERLLQAAREALRRIGEGG